MSAFEGLAEAFSKLGDLREMAGRTFGSLLRAEVGDYCQLVANDGEMAAATEEGALVSYLRLRGSERMLNRKSVEALVGQSINALGSVLKRSGVRIDVSFTRDPEVALGQVREALEPSYATAQRFGIQAGPMLDERVGLLGRMTSGEECLIAVQLDVNALSPSGLRNDRNTLKEKASKAGGPLRPGANGQTPWLALESIRVQHDALVESVLHAFPQQSIEALSIRQALTAIKALIEPEMAQGWAPRLLGDKFPLRAGKEPTLGEDLSHVLPLPIGRQILTSTPLREGVMVQIGSRWHAPVSVTMPPLNVRPFLTFFESVPVDVPWRMVISLRSGHDRALASLGRKSSIAAVVAFTNSGNRGVVEACEELQAMASGGEVLAYASITFDTWGATKEVAKERMERMVRAIQGWGQMEVTQERGDPLACVLETLPGFVPKLCSPALVMPLFDVLSLWPFGRPSSPWDAGPVMLRTDDRKLFPLHPGSSKQPSVVSLVFAPPGTGKSVKLASDNMALLLAPGLEDIPRIAILDIGPTSAHFIRLVRSLLPRERRHEALSMALEMDGRDRINPLDTPLGCRYPINVDRQACVSLVELVLTPAGSREVVTRLPELSGELVDAMYSMRADDDDRAHPNQYERDVAPDVDSAVDDAGVPFGEGTLWWEVVDGLFEAGRLREAAEAQRHAVPTLSDMSPALTWSRSLQNVYQGARLAGGEGLLDFVTSMIPGFLGEYPLLSGISTYSLGEARIVSIDLMAVTGQGSAQAEKRTSVMYLVARQMLCQSFYRGEDMIHEFPERYRSHHEAEIRRNSRAPKRLCLDEYHRVRGCPQVREQTVRDAREGRKYGVQLSVISQMLDDFGKDLVELSSNVFVLGRSLRESGVQEICDTFGVSDEGAEAIRLQLTGPTPEGAPMVYLGKVSGTVGLEHLVRLSMGPLELWAYNTTPEDAALRSQMLREVGVVRALKQLAAHHPSGSAKSLIEESELGEARDAVYRRLVNRMVEHSV